jgi:glutaconate CoA-transferase subunit B
MIYEAGVIGAQPARLPLSIGDPTLVSGALSVCSMYDIFAFYLQRGNVDVGFMGGAQIDRFGNVNATVIGDYAHPKVRLPGSGGSMEIAAWANRCYLLTPHTKRRFPAKLDFRTSAGFLNGRAEREAACLRGGGMLAVVTDLGLLEPDESGGSDCGFAHQIASEGCARTHRSSGTRSLLRFASVRSCSLPGGF